MGTVGALIAEWIGIPAGMIVGALLTSGLYRLAGGEPGAWRGRYGRVGRLLLGTFIGAAFGPDVIATLKAALVPTLVLIVCIIGVGLGLGWALGRFTKLDPTTALISTVPGGLPAMVGMAEEMDADTTVVAAIHFSRLTMILLAIPVLMPLLTKTSLDTVTAVALNKPVGFWGTAITLSGGLISGLLAIRGGVPSGDLIGPILVVGGANLLGAGLGPLAKGIQQGAVLLIGTAVGAQMSRESLRRLRQVVLPATAFVVAIIAMGMLLGWGLSMVTPLDSATALLSSVPGGASTMLAVAHDLGGDLRLVASIHLARQLVVLILVPPVLGRFLCGKLGRNAVSPTLGSDG